jgi:flagellar hook-associated protein 1 FlgK
MQDLGAHPSEIIWQNQAVAAAEKMASRFRTMGEFLTTLETQIQAQAQSIVGQINTLTTQIAELNNKISTREMAGGQANNLRDQRDQLIVDLSKLVGVETQEYEFGVVYVNAAGIPVVTDTTSMDIEVGLASAADGSLGVSAVGAYSYDTTIQRGELGGLLALKNTLVSDIHTSLDTLAAEMMKQVNQYHVQGVGSAGSFTQLAGLSMPDTDLADFNPPVTDGNIYIRVTNTSTGEVARSAVAVDASADSLSTLATAISGITGLTGSVTSSRLNILADANYKFDFLPAVLPSPTASALTGTSPPAISVSGVFTGTQNDTFRFSISGAGTVGNGTLQLEVKDNSGAGNVIATLSIGSGYAAGDTLDVGNGIQVSIGAGDFGAGDSFDVDAFASSDTTGVLSAVGMNTLFSGASAASMMVRSDIVSSHTRIAAALGADMTDNTNALRIASIKDLAISNLNSLTAPEYYRRLATNIGTLVSGRKMNQDNVEVIVQDLARQRDEISGVDINDESARLLLMEQMYKATAAFMRTIQTSLATVIEII